MTYCLTGVVPISVPSLEAATVESPNMATYTRAPGGSDVTEISLVTSAKTALNVESSARWRRACLARRYASGYLAWAANA